MSTTLAPPPPRSFAAKWRDFWFAPGDPTTLGFIRVVAGILIVYLHLSYTFDLYGFFGKYGWYGQEYVNRDRHEYPSQAMPLNDTWDDVPAAADVPEFPHRKKAVVDFINRLPADPARRADALRYLNRLLMTNNSEAGRAGLRYLLMIFENDDRREEALRKFVADAPALGEAPKAPDENAAVPALFQPMPKDERQAVADEIRAFIALLYAPPPAGGRARDPEDARYVLQHLVECDHDSLKAFVRFLVALPADPAEMERLTGYLAYWHAEPSRTVRIGHPIFSVWFHVSDRPTMTAIHFGILAVMVLFTLGVFTRVTSVLTWLSALCYIHRSQQVLFGMDTMMSILLFYLMIGNSGAALSVDRVVQRYRAARASIRRTGGIDEPTRAFLAAPPPSVTAGFAIRLLQVHFCFIYMASGMSKLKGGAWWNGNAIWDVMVVPEFTLLRYPWYEQMMNVIAGSKPVYYTFISCGAWFTLFLELGLPFLIWTRLRPVMVFMATLLHAGIGVLMGLNLFELMMMAMLLAYIPGGVIREWIRGKVGGKPLGFRFDGRSAGGGRAAAAVAAADLDGVVRFDPAGEIAAAPVLTVADGTPAAREAAFGTLAGSLRLLRGLWLILLLPGLRGWLTRVMFPAAPAGGEPTPPKRGVGGPSRPTAAS